MSYTSMGFLIFLLAGVIVYYIIPKKFQWVWLLVISYFFYICSGIEALIFIVMTTVTTYGGALWIEKIDDERSSYVKEHKGDMSSEEKKAYKLKTRKYKRLILALILVINFGVLAVIKYNQVVIDAMNSIIQNVMHFDFKIGNINVIVPLGVSFYTFQSMGYLIDVYQGKYRADRNIAKFALFVSYFPQILQGPIGRFNKLSHQFFERHEFELRRIEHGLQLMAWGFFKKMVIADRAGVAVKEIFRYMHLYTGADILYGVLLYSVQLYADFSGGMDIVMGASELFGIKLSENFRQPYFAVSIADYWHRWHITLGAWMKDYIFYPFSLSKGMNKFGKWLNKRFGKHLSRVIPIGLANILIFFVVGVWHGSEFKYVVYGLYNGILLTMADLFAPLYPKMFKAAHINKDSKGWHIVRIIRTYLLVFISLYFDVADCAYSAFFLMKNSILGFSFSQITDGSMLKLGVKAGDLVILIAALIVLFVVSFIREKGIHIREALDTKPLLVRWAVYFALVMSIPVLGKIITGTGGFMYAQF